MKHYNSIIKDNNPSFTNSTALRKNPMTTIKEQHCTKQENVFPSKEMFMALGHCLSPVGISSGLASY